MLGLPDGEPEGVVRRLAATTAAGLVAGVLWVGVVGRVVMRVIALLNPDAAGMHSDDDFVIGQFTVSGTLNFAVVGLLMGALGGLLYLALRGLRVGPRWFQLLSVSLPPALIALQQIVHPEGVDFRALQPAEASLAMFLLVTWGFTLTLELLAERWLRPGSRFETAPIGVLALLLLPTIVVAPLALALALGWLVLQQVRVPAFGPWLVRAGLLALFVVALADLLRKVSLVV